MPISPRIDRTSIADILVRTMAPLLLAIVTAGLLIGAMGANPMAFFADVLRFGLAGDGWQQSLTAMAPLLLIAAGLIVAFRAGLWNLGYGGSYLLAAALVAGLAPSAMAALPFPVATTLLFALACSVGALLGLLPAWLKNRNGTNEVVTSLMVSFIATGAANLLVRGPLQDPAVTVPQTRVLPLGDMLPYLPGTRVHIGLLLSLVVVLVLHLMLTRSAFGLQLDVLGANPRAAAHAGLDVKRLTVIVFLLSGGLFGLAAATDMLGLWGYLRTGWNPGYGDKILPFVFLARLSPLGTVPLVAFYAVLATGGTLAAQRAGLSVDVLLVFVALVLFYMVLLEALGRWRGNAARNGRAFGRSYLSRRGGAR